MNKRQVKTKTAKMCIEDGILHCKLLPNSEINLVDAKEIVNQTLKLCHGKNIPILGDLSEAKYISIESRKYLSGQEANKAASSLAIIANTMVGKIIGNFLIGLNKPSYPVKLFTSEEKALDWLKQFMELKEE